MTYVFCSQSHSDIVVRVDCSNSRNCLSHRGDLDSTIKLDANRTEVNCVDVIFSHIISIFVILVLYTVC